MSPSSAADPVDFAAAEQLIAAALAPRAEGPTRIGAEVEWLVYDRLDRRRTVPAQETEAATTGVSLPHGGSISVEPGGQLELSTTVHTDPDELCASIDRDEHTLGEFAGRAGLELVSYGLDPLRTPAVTLHQPRYRAMAEHFRMVCPHGLRMMTGTAALQISIDLGDDSLGRWRQFSSVAPVLSAAFANSGPGRRSARQALWASIERCRTAPVPTGSATDWVNYVLDASVMVAAGPIPRRYRHRPFRWWLADRHDAPTVADAQVHLTTMFPPLRPRGHLELRMLDALSGPGRHAAVGVVWALATDAELGASVDERCAGLQGAWRRALSGGLDDPGIRQAADALLAGAARALDGGGRTALAERCERWRDVRAGDATTR